MKVRKNPKKKRSKRFDLSAVDSFKYVPEVKRSSEVQGKFQRPNTNETIKVNRARDKEQGFRFEYSRES